MSAADHIIILQNGLSGHHSRMASIVTFLRQSFPGNNFAIAVSDVNNLFSTYFGIEPCGQRLRDYVKAQCRLHPHASKISFIGHSLGGLIIRHCIGLLQEEGFFGPDTSKQQMEPVLYISIASPHLGVQNLDNFRQALARWVIRGTGEPLLLEDPEKLLVKMSALDSVYMMGLRRFRLIAYGNLVGDKLVNFESACLCISRNVQFTVDEDSEPLLIASEALAVGQLVRVVHTNSRLDSESSQDARAICENLLTLPWKCYAINLDGWLNPHNAICNKGLTQSLGFSNQTAVLESIVRHLSETTGLQPTFPGGGGDGCSVM